MISTSGSIRDLLSTLLAARLDIYNNRELGEHNGYTILSTFSDGSLEKSFFYILCDHSKTNFPLQVKKEIDAVLNSVCHVIHQKNLNITPHFTAPVWVHNIFSLAHNNDYYWHVPESTPSLTQLEDSIPPHSYPNDARTPRSQDRKEGEREAVVHCPVHPSSPTASIFSPSLHTASSIHTHQHVPTLDKSLLRNRPSSENSPSHTPYDRVEQDDADDTESDSEYHISPEKTSHYNVKSLPPTACAQISHGTSLELVLAPNCLHFAAKMGFLPIVEAILAGFPPDWVNQPDHEGYPPLWWTLREQKFRKCSSFMGYVHPTLLRVPSSRPHTPTPLQASSTQAPASATQYPTLPTLPPTAAHIVPDATTPVPSAMAVAILPPALHATSPTMSQAILPAASHTSLMAVARGVPSAVRHSAHSTLPCHAVSPATLTAMPHLTTLASSSGTPLAGPQAVHSTTTHPTMVDAGAAAGAGVGAAVIDQSMSSACVGLEYRSASNNSIGVVCYPTSVSGSHDRALDVLVPMRHTAVHSVFPTEMQVTLHNDSHAFMPDAAFFTPDTGACAAATAATNASISQRATDTRVFNAVSCSRVAGAPGDSAGADVDVTGSAADVEETSSCLSAETSVTRADAAAPPRCQHLASLAHSSSHSSSFLPPSPLHLSPPAFQPLISTPPRCPPHPPIATASSSLHPLTDSPSSAPHTDASAALSPHTRTPTPVSISSITAQTASSSLLHIATTPQLTDMLPNTHISTEAGSLAPSPACVGVQVICAALAPPTAPTLIATGPVTAGSATYVGGTPATATDSSVPFPQTAGGLTTHPVQLPSLQPSLLTAETSTVDSRPTTLSFATSSSQTLNTSSCSSSTLSFKAGPPAPVSPCGVAQISACHSLPASTPSASKLWSSPPLLNSANNVASADREHVNSRSSTPNQILYENRESFHLSQHLSQNRAFTPIDEHVSVDYSPSIGQDCSAVFEDLLWGSEASYLPIIAPVPIPASGHIPVPVSSQIPVPGGVPVPIHTNVASPSPLPLPAAAVMPVGAVTAARPGLVPVAIVDPAELSVSAAATAMPVSMSIGAPGATMLGSMPMQVAAAETTTVLVVEQGPLLTQPHEQTHSPVAAGGAPSICAPVAAAPHKASLYENFTEKEPNSQFSARYPDEEKSQCEVHSYREEYSQYDVNSVNALPIPLHLSGPVPVSCAVSCSPHPSRSQSPSQPLASPHILTTNSHATTTIATCNTTTGSIPNTTSTKHLPTYSASLLPRATCTQDGYGDSICFLLAPVACPSAGTSDYYDSIYTLTTAFAASQASGASYRTHLHYGSIAQDLYQGATTPCTHHNATTPYTNHAAVRPGVECEVAVARTHRDVGVLHIDRDTMAQDILHNTVLSTIYPDAAAPSMDTTTAAPTTRHDGAVTHDVSAISTPCDTTESKRCDLALPITACGSAMLCVRSTVATHSTDGSVATHSADSGVAAQSDCSAIPTSYAQPPLAPTPNAALSRQEEVSSLHIRWRDSSAHAHAGWEENLQHKNASAGADAGADANIVAGNGMHNVPEHVDAYTPLPPVSEFLRFPNPPFSQFSSRGRSRRQSYLHEEARPSRHTSPTSPSQASELFISPARSSTGDAGGEDHDGGEGVADAGVDIDGEEGVDDVGVDSGCNTQEDVGRDNSACTVMDASVGNGGHTTAGVGVDTGNAAGTAACAGAGAGTGMSPKRSKNANAGSNHVLGPIKADMQDTSTLYREPNPLRVPGHAILFDVRSSSPAEDDVWSEHVPVADGSVIATTTISSDMLTRQDGMRTSQLMTVSSAPSAPSSPSTFASSSPSLSPSSSLSSLEHYPSPYPSLHPSTSTSSSSSSSPSPSAPRSPSAPAHTRRLRVTSPTEDLSRFHDTSLLRPHDNSLLRAYDNTLLRPHDAYLTSHSNQGHSHNYNPCTSHGAGNGYVYGDMYNYSSRSPPLEGSPRPRSVLQRVNSTSRALLSYCSSSSFSSMSSSLSPCSVASSSSLLSSSSFTSLSSSPSALSPSPPPSLPSPLSSASCSPEVLAPASPGSASSYASASAPFCASYAAFSLAPSSTPTSATFPAPPLSSTSAPPSSTSAASTSSAQPHPPHASLPITLTDPLTNPTPLHPVYPPSSACASHSPCKSPQHPLLRSVSPHSPLLGSASLVPHRSTSPTSINTHTTTRITTCSPPVSPEIPSNTTQTTPSCTMSATAPPLATLPALSPAIQASRAWPTALMSHLRNFQSTSDRCADDGEHESRAFPTCVLAGAPHTLERRSHAAGVRDIASGPSIDLRAEKIPPKTPSEAVSEARLAADPMLPPLPASPSSSFSSAAASFPSHTLHHTLLPAYHCVPSTFSPTASPHPSSLEPTPLRDAIPPHIPDNRIASAIDAGTSYHAGVACGNVDKGLSQLRLQVHVQSCTKAYTDTCVHKCTHALPYSSTETGTGASAGTSVGMRTGKVKPLCFSSPTGDDIYTSSYCCSFRVLPSTPRLTRATHTPTTQTHTPFLSTTLPHAASVATTLARTTPLMHAPHTTAALADTPSTYTPPFVYASLSPTAPTTPSHSTTATVHKLAAAVHNHAVVAVAHNHTAVSPACNYTPITATPSNVTLGASACDHALSPDTELPPTPSSTPSIALPRHPALSDARSAPASSRAAPAPAPPLTHAPSLHSTPHTCSPQPPPRLCAAAEGDCQVSYHSTFEDRVSLRQHAKDDHSSNIESTSVILAQPLPAPRASPHTPRVARVRPHSGHSRPARVAHRRASFANSAHTSTSASIWASSFTSTSTPFSTYTLARHPACVTPSPSRPPSPSNSTITSPSTSTLPLFPSSLNFSRSPSASPRAPAPYADSSCAWPARACAIALLERRADVYSLVFGRTLLMEALQTHCDDAVEVLCQYMMRQM